MSYNAFPPMPKWEERDRVFKALAMALRFIKPGTPITVIDEIRSTLALGPRHDPDYGRTFPSEPEEKK